MGDVLGGKSITVLSSISKRAHTRTRDAISLSLSLSSLQTRCLRLLTTTTTNNNNNTSGFANLSSLLLSLIYI